MKKVSYGPLWKVLIDKHMTKTELRKSAELSRGTITKTGKDEPSGLDIILKIATALDTISVNDIVEIVEAVDAETTQVC